MRTKSIYLLVAGLLFATLGTLSAQTAAAPAQTNKWESVASAGVTLTRGNSHNFLATAGLNSTRKWAMDEMLLGINGGYGETTKRTPAPSTTSKTEDYLKGFAQWNHLFTPRFFAGLRLDAVHDDIADIDY